jgi:SAM-dependent MidA family methyltransferase
LAADGSAASRQLSNAWEVHREIALPAGVDAAAVREYFPSFRDYQDIVMFHPAAGYYASGRVSFSADYRTFPIALAPYFGQMIAEQIFHMWEGMRAAGTLAPRDHFTIAEFGAGDGALAETLLDYLDQQAAGNPDRRWRDFANQTIYACYDRSPALSAAQRRRNARFGKRFEARQADATDPAGEISAGSLKGVVLSNELPDAFSVHKVILMPDGSAEVSFVAPSLTRAAWNQIEKSVTPPARELVVKDAQSIQAKFFPGRKGEEIFLSREALNALLTVMSSWADYTVKVDLIQFHEMYLPVSAVPELARHLGQYAHEYAREAAKSKQGLVAYVNLGEGKFIQGAGRILSAGYVVTIDYGSNWDGILDREVGHLRTFGTGVDKDHPDPYHSPTLNDITTDVNFSHMASEGRSVGLHPVYYGPQHALQTKTPIDLSIPPPNREFTDVQLQDFESWVKDFWGWEVFKVLVQQKENTDSAYRFPELKGEPLGLIEEERLPVAVH